jgi:hypothetical protein
MNTCMRGFLVALTGAMLVGAPAAAEAQMQVAGEGRIGVALPTGDLSNEGAQAGLALGAELMFNFQRNLTAYVGLNRHGFSCDRDCDLGRNPRSTGLGAGLKYILPGPSDAHWWVRGGLVAQQIVTDDRTGSRNLGFEVGTGIDMPVAPRLHLVPNISLISHEAGRVGTATYLNLGIGIHYHFH